MKPLDKGQVFTTEPKHIISSKNCIPSTFRSSHCVSFVNARGPDAISPSIRALKTDPTFTPVSNTVVFSYSQTREDPYNSTLSSVSEVKETRFDTFFHSLLFPSLLLLLEQFPTSYVPIAEICFCMKVAMHIRFFKWGCLKCFQSSQDLRPND